jgi:hypothetical protein
MPKVGDQVEVFATSLELANEADAYTFTLEDSFTCVVEAVEDDGSFTVKGHDNAGKDIYLIDVKVGKPEGEGFYIVE